MCTHTYIHTHTHTLYMSAHVQYTKRHAQTPTHTYNAGKESNGRGTNYHV